MTITKKDIEKKIEKLENQKKNILEKKDKKAKEIDDKLVEFKAKLQAEKNEKLASFNKELDEIAKETMKCKKALAIIEKQENDLNKLLSDDTTEEPKTTVETPQENG